MEDKQMLKMRLTRLGDKKTPFYRIVVADSRKARDGEYVEQIGTFNPLVTTEDVKIDAEKATKWLAAGAQPTDTVKALLKKSGVIADKKAK
jgi:small subunit ribosomal protein S16